jgi:hypothetical protein
MKRSTMLMIASLVSIVLLMCHLADDFARGISPVGPWVLITLPFIGAWLYATLVVPERRAGYIANLLGGMAALLMPVLHLRHVWSAVSIAKPGTFFFSFTLLALGGLGIFSIIVAVRGLLNPQWGSAKN